MKRPEFSPNPQPVTLDPGKSALLVLDISQRCADPKLPCHRLGHAMTGFLEKARGAGLLIVFTISANLKGTPEGEVYSILKRRPSEAVLFPDAFNKFAGGELQGLLKLYDIDTLVITGYRTNIAVLYTATTAVRELKYKVVIPIDGVAATTDYEQEYTFYQFTVIRPEAARLFTFTRLDMIDFRSVA